MLSSALNKLDVFKQFIIYHIVYLFEKSEILFLLLFSSYFFAQTIFPFAPVFAVLKWALLIAFVAINLITIGLNAERSETFIHDKLYWFIGLFVFYLFINSLLSINIVVSLSRTVLLLISLILWFVILPNYFREEKKILKLFDYLFYIFAIILFINIFLTIMVPSAYFRIGIYIRYRGITENANTLGMYSMIAVVFIFYKLKTGTRFEKTLSVFLLFLVAINFLLTVSRSSILAAFIITMFFTYHYYRKWFYTGVILGILILISLMVFPILIELLRLASNPLSYRDQLFSIALSQWKKNMLFGQGYGTTTILTSKLFVFFQKGYNLLNIGKHLGSMYVEMLTEIGIIGVILFIPIIIRLYLKQNRISRYVSGNLHIILILYKGLFLGILVQNIFESALLAPGNGVAFLFWSLSGLLLSIEKFAPTKKMQRI